MIKLDTDGHDADILLQATDVLTVAQPVVFFEFDSTMAAGVDGTDPTAALDLMGEIGYRRALFFTNTGCLVARARRGRLGFGGACDGGRRRTRSCRGVLRRLRVRSGRCRAR